MPNDVISGKDKSYQAFKQISDTIIACYRVYPEKNQPLRPFEKENFSYSMNQVLLSWNDVTACWAQGSFRFYQSANLERRGSSGKFETRFHREIGSEQEKKFGRVIYASETIQNCKNPTGDIGTLITFRRVFFLNSVFSFRHR